MEYAKRKKRKLKNIRNMKKKADWKKKIATAISIILQGLTYQSTFFSGTEKYLGHR